MPGKPSRRDRHRSGAGGRAPASRPRPAPPVSPQRLARQERERRPELEETAEGEVLDQQIEEKAAPVSASQQSSPSTERRRATTSARTLEVQREERLRRDAVRDLRRIGITAGVTLVALAALIILS